MSEPGSPLARALDPTSGTWTLDQALLAAVVDNLNWVLYGMASLSGAKGLQKPKPIKRPWANPDDDREVQQFRGDVMSADEMDRWADQFRPEPKFTTE